MFTILVFNETSVVIPEIVLLKNFCLLLFLGIFVCFLQVLLPESKPFCPQKITTGGLPPASPHLPHKHGKLPSVLSQHRSYWVGSHCTTVNMSVFYLLMYKHDYQPLNHLAVYFLIEGSKSPVCLVLWILDLIHNFFYIVNF